MTLARAHGSTRETAKVHQLWQLTVISCEYWLTVYWMMPYPSNMVRERGVHVVNLGDMGLNLMGNLVYSDL